MHEQHRELLVKVLTKYAGTAQADDIKDLVHVARHYARLYEHGRFMRAGLQAQVAKLTSENRFLTEMINDDEV